MSEIIGYNDRVILDQYGASIGGGDGSRSSRPTCSAFPPSISNLDRARKAVAGGASLSPCSFYRSGQGYTGILTTKRGKQYAVPHRIMAIISGPNEQGEAQSPTK